MPRFAARGPVEGRVRFPFFVGYFFIVELAYSRGLLLLGQTDVLPRLRSSSSLAIVSCTSSILVTCSTGTRGTGAAGRVSRPRLRTTSGSPISKAHSELESDGVYLVGYVLICVCIVLAFSCKGPSKCVVVGLFFLVRVCSQGSTTHAVPHHSACMLALIFR